MDLGNLPCNRLKESESGCFVESFQATYFFAILKLAFPRNSRHCQGPRSNFEIGEGGGGGALVTRY